MACSSIADNTATVVIGRSDAVYGDRELYTSGVNTTRPGVTVYCRNSTNCSTTLFNDGGCPVNGSYGLVSCYFGELIIIWHFKWN